MQRYALVMIQKDYLHLARRRLKVKIRQNATKTALVILVKSLSRMQQIVCLNSAEAALVFHLFFAQ